MTQIGPAIRHARVLRDYHCNVQNVTMFNRSLKQTAITNVFVNQSSTQPMLAPESCWDSPNSSRNFTTKFQFLSKWIQTRQDTFCIAEDQADSNTLGYDAYQYKMNMTLQTLVISILKKAVTVKMRADVPMNLRTN